MSKVGRNDPCPCGSGKKYKKCCEARRHEDKKIRASLIKGGGRANMAAAISSIGSAMKAAAEPKPKEQE